jgi:purine-binding chemotaxis protein CheW
MVERRDRIEEHAEVATPKPGTVMRRDVGRQAGEQGSSERPIEMPLDSKLLQQRAREVAEPLDYTTHSPSATVLIVRLGEALWGLPIVQVRSVESLHLAPIPAAPPKVAGLAARMGRVVPVFDLRVVLGVPAQSAGERGLVVIAGSPEDEVGLLIDAALRTEVLDLDTLQPLPEAGRDAPRGVILGSTPEGTPVLDLGGMLQSELLIVAAGGGRCESA